MAVAQAMPTLLHHNAAAMAPPSHSAIRMRAVVGCGAVRKNLNVPASVSRQAFLGRRVVAPQGSVLVRRKRIQLVPRASSEDTTPEFAKVVLVFLMRCLLLVCIGVSSFL